MGLTMRLTVIAIATGLLAMGCTPPPDAAQTVPVDLQGFETVDWPELEGYCTFYADGHGFDAGDESTWRFVFVKPFTPSRRDAWGVIGLDGERQTLSEVSRGTDTRRYQVIDRPEIEVEVTMVAAGQRDGPGRYTGELQRVAPERGAPVPIRGNCTPW